MPIDTDCYVPRLFRVCHPPYSRVKAGACLAVVWAVRAPHGEWDTRGSVAQTRARWETPPGLMLAALRDGAVFASEGRIPQVEFYVLRFVE